MYLVSRIGTHPSVGSFFPKFYLALPDSLFSIVPSYFVRISRNNKGAQQNPPQHSSPLLQIFTSFLLLERLSEAQLHAHEITTKGDDSPNKSKPSCCDSQLLAIENNHLPYVSFPFPPLLHRFSKLQFGSPTPASQARILKNLEVLKGREALSFHMSISQQR